MEGIYDSVCYYCPVCKERVEVMHHLPYTCGCGKEWLTPAPVYDKMGVKIEAEREINGIPQPKRIL